MHTYRAAAAEARADAAPGRETEDWRREWEALRCAQLRLQGRQSLAHPARLAAGGGESAASAAAGLAPQIDFLRRSGSWSAASAEGYTLLTCCCNAALAEANRRGGDGAKASLRLVRSVLADVASKQVASGCGDGGVAAVPPPAYASLRGELGLVTSDPQWDRLTREAAAGTSLTTTGLTLGVSGPELFPNVDGLHLRTCRGGVLEWSKIDSDVVCFVSRWS